MNLELGILDIIFRMLVGAGLGFTISLTGIGGGVLVIPALAIFFGMPPTTAVGTANLFAFLTKISGSYHHWREKNIDLRLIFPFLLTAVPCSILAAYAINRRVSYLVGDRAAWVSFQDDLKMVLAIVILIAAAALFFRDHLLKGGKQDAAPHGLIRKRWARILFALGMGLVVGILIGATSIGGGVLLIPALMLFLGLSPRKTVGTSILFALILTFVSSLVYGLNGEADFVGAVLMALGAFLVVPVGVRLAVRLSPARLEKIVLVIVLLAAVALFSITTH